MSIPPSRSWYCATIAELIKADASTVLGELTKHCNFTLLPSQREAWLAQVQILRRQLVNLSGWVFFEFSIPRMGRRADVVLVIGPVVFVVEFKVGEKRFNRNAIEQVWDYALDLKNFHEASHDVLIAPILVVTEAAPSSKHQLLCDEDKVCRPLMVDAAGLRDVIDLVLNTAVGCAIDAKAWACASYHPTPTIVEAARALYSQHSVEAIARFDAGAQNLHITSKRIEDLIEEARVKKRKYICFVTGVPGAGKTLLGLNVATIKRNTDQPTHAVYLSGNGPLVAVLREALTRDELIRRKQQGEKTHKGKIGDSVKAFIQNIHHFRDDGLIDSKPPIEHVVIFDEAQRAWNLKQTANFMRNKKGREGINQSEPELLIAYMDRHKDWAVIICLVGGGQEINTGEAGIEAWLNAMQVRFNHWKIFISSRIIDSEYAAGHALDLVQKSPTAHFDDSLHLAVPMRSFRTEKVSEFVKALLDLQKQQARLAFDEISPRYPIVLTRDFEKAKNWIRDRGRGSERYGLVASSRAMRLKPHAIDIRVAVNPVHYFLNERDDPRSSFYLEDAATEFKVQGLELDWACVAWDADFRFDGSSWNYKDFRGKRWCNILDSDNRIYLRNAYRVLLTRARQGMVIFVPPGDQRDPTRPPAFYDSTFHYLKELGIPEIS